MTMRALLLILVFSPLAAEERIHDYQVDIRVQPDSTMSVTERITVTAEGRAIRRGIYRDFPTRYHDRLGNRYRVGFQVESIERDGRAEPYRLESTPDGQRVYIGNASRFLPEGRYTYTIEYRTDRQLGYFEQHDELYWNAIGTQWNFAIDNAVIRLQLPPGIPAGDIAAESYSGARGSSTSFVTQQVLDDGSIRYQSQRALAAREGITIVASWPKGYVQVPSTQQKIRWLLRDNKGLLFALISVLGLLAYYLWFWNKVGRDPKPGTIIPRFEPPDGISPAGSRHLDKMGFDKKALTAAIISLAVKGALRIDQKDRKILKDKYWLYRVAEGPKKPLTAGETAVLNELLPGGADELELVNSNHKALQAAAKALKAQLKQEQHGLLFKNNTGYLFPALAISVLAMLALIALQPPAYVYPVFFVVVAALHVIFVWLLKAPTFKGREVMDQVEGLKRYLQTAEQDRLNRMRSPKLTPEVFETFLPYAYALNVENDWSEAFKKALLQALATQQGAQQAYQPHWYSGSGYGGTDFLDNLGSNLSSGLGSAVSSASSPPGSSSGSGGGGFSGGGGGGGGGGGW